MFCFGGNFVYQLLQLSPQSLKMKIKSAKDARQKKKYFIAMTVRSILLILFAIFYISLFTQIFGSENSSVAVGSFCMLLGIRFVSYGYEIKESLLAFGIVLSLNYFGGIASLLGNNVGKLILHFLFLLVILILVANDPIMGNAGIYVFSYLFIVENPVTGQALQLRIMALVFVFLSCGIIMYSKHKNKHKTLYLKDIFKSFCLKERKTLWQIRLASGVSMALFTGHILQLPRTVWIGYACMSILLPYSNQLFTRAFIRVSGVIIGSVLFGLAMSSIPEQLTFILGPLAGLLIGFSASYWGNSVLNCFGALILASSIYGTHSAILFRIQNNFLGAFFAIIIVLLFNQLVDSKYD